jgi:two-component system chemotaxis sensor kinase CheA
MTESSEYKDMFIEESREHLSIINQALLDFEKDPKNKDAMNKIFRAAHTIKGMSATMNYDKIQKLSHRTEDTLDLIRNNKLEVNSDIIDLIFKCFDGIEEMIEDIASSDITEFDVECLVGELEKHLDNKGAGKNEKTIQEKKESNKKNPDKISINKAAEKKIIKEIESANYAYKISIVLDKTCLMKSIRSFLVLKKLGDDGNIVYSIPDKKAIEDGKFDEGFEIYYTSEEGKEAVEQIIDSVSEIDTRIVSPMEYENDELRIFKNRRKTRKSLK